MTLYTVKQDDSLSKISMALYGTYDRWPEIAQINNIPGPNYTIKPGQVLQLPNSTGSGTEESPRVINNALTVTAKAEPAQPLFRLFGFGITKTQLMITTIGLALLFAMPPKGKKYGSRKAKRKK